MSAVDEHPYRGCVELPRTLFDELKALGTVIVEEAVKAATPKPPRSAPPMSLARAIMDHPRMLLGIVADRGFVELQTHRHALHYVLEIAAVHRCGAVAVVDVCERTLVLAESTPGALVDALDGLGCYCVEIPTATARERGGR